MTYPRTTRGKLSLISKVSLTITPWNHHTKSKSNYRCRKKCIYIHITHHIIHITHTCTIHLQGIPHHTFHKHTTYIYHTHHTHHRHIHLYYLLHRPYHTNHKHPCINIHHIITHTTKSPYHMTHATHTM